MLLLFILFIKYFFFGIAPMDGPDTTSLISPMNVPEETYYIIPKKITRGLQLQLWAFVFVGPFHPFSCF